MKLPRLLSLAVALSFLSLVGLPLYGASIPGLFGTGVDNSNAPLPTGATDPHYRLIVSADLAAPGPDTVVANYPGTGWMPKTAESEWIAPQVDQRYPGGGSQPGDYVYRLSFDLTGFDLSTVTLTGQWACDSEGIDIRINGASTGNKIPPYPPQPSESWHSFTISTGFVDGTNTLDFVVNRSSGRYPTGLRAEVSGTGVQTVMKVPGLFGTGVDNNNAPLPTGATDPHYRLIVSADPAAPGPDTVVANYPGTGWMPKTAESEWIAPQVDQRYPGGGSEPGDYVYRLSFNLTGMDPSTVTLTGQWACDSEGTDIRVNGAGTGNKIPPYPPQPSESWHPFTISAGFVDGTNTLDFVVNRSSGRYPTGLRAEVSGMGMIAGNVAPEFGVQPKSQAVDLGTSVSLFVSVKGLGLSYQWRHNGTNVPGATSARLEIANVEESDFGVYEVVASNALGTATSHPATLSLATPIPGLFNTGVDDQQAVLIGWTVDPHYGLIASSDPDYPGPDSFVEEPVPGDWVANSLGSAWIGPSEDATLGTYSGHYTYRLTFNLSGFNPVTARIEGNWAANSSVTAVLLNGKATGLSMGPFEPARALRPFAIESGFLPGTNTLDFWVYNWKGGAYGGSNPMVDYNPTGLRVEITGVAGIVPPNTAPMIVTQPESQMVLEGERASLRVIASGSMPLDYQWRLNGANVAGATSETLVIDKMSASNAGAYDVVVSNTAGAKTSDPATLTPILPSSLTPIPGLFATGVDNNKAPLAAGAVDPHFTLITSADTSFAGPAVLVVNDNAPFPPTGIWLANGPNSKWVAPRAEEAYHGQGGVAGGQYVYRITFDLTGLDPSAVRIEGQWSVDSEGLDILINGAGTGNKIKFWPPHPAASWQRFSITNGFSASLNTLDFVVNHNNGLGYCSGLRVELQGFAGIVPPNTPPAILKQPTNQVVLQGRSATFNVAVRGSMPLSYQWRLNGHNLSVANSSTLLIASVAEADGGIYDVVVSNASGSATSAPVTLSPILIIGSIAGVFNTGVGDNKALLADGAVDPHYKLTISADTNFPGPDAFVVNEASPISPLGPWLASGPDSRWIAPQANQVMPDGGNAMGDYVYRITFNLAADTFNSARIEGRWAADSEGVNIRLNGTNTDWRIKPKIEPYQPHASESWHPFTITDGFAVGVNTLDFLINRRAGTNPTGLRAEWQGLLVRPVVIVSPEQPLITSPKLTGNTFSMNVTTQAGASYTVEYKDKLNDATWTTLTTFTGDGNPKPITATATTGASRFYRVRR